MAVKRWGGYREHGNTWSFVADCPTCRRAQRFLVTEPADGGNVGRQQLARCRSCTRVVGVTAEHRRARQQVPDGLLDGRDPEF